LVSNGACLECIALIKSDADKKHYLKYADKIKASVKKYQRENIEIILPKKRIRHFKNRERNIEISRQRYAKYRDEDVERKRNEYRSNPEYFREKTRRRYKEDKTPWIVGSRNRKACERKAEGRHTTKEIRNLLTKQRDKCINCLTCIKSGYHIDHIKPLSRGGSNWISNQLLCAPCNLRKRAHDPIDFAHMEGRLL
jgi:5-methylcytosine-specific restriction endonuclease McrA